MGFLHLKSHYSFVRKGYASISACLSALENHCVIQQYLVLKDFEGF